MKIVCPDCQAAYNVSDDRIPAGGAKGKCKCGSVLKFRRDVAPEQAVNQSITLEQANDAAEAEAAQTVMRIFGNSELYSQKLEEWRSVYSQSPEVAAMLLEMWNTVDDAATKITEPLFGGELANRKLEEWRSLLAQSPEQAADLLKMWVAEYKAKEDNNECIRQTTIALRRSAQFRLWSLIQEPPEKLTNQLPLSDAEVKQQEEYEKEALTLTAEEKAKKVIEITKVNFAQIPGSTRLERDQKCDQKFEEWRSLFAQSPEQAANLLKMWVAAYNASHVMLYFGLASGNMPLANQKFTEWQSLYRQSPEQAMDFLKMAMGEILSGNDDESQKVRVEAGLEIERIFGYLDPCKFEEWHTFFTQSPEQAANLLTTWAELKAREEKDEFPLNILCSRCGSTARIFDINNERTAAKYACFFCNKTTIHRSHQSPEKRRREAITESARVAVLTRAGQCCEICGSNQNLHIDHIVPFSKGGSNDMKNLQLLCRECNLRKGGN